ncbi:putative bifunctional diguanylate cyclase/phosphodiesterase [Pannonibacter sp. SL95]|uniref:putative bifunctional diguanylate cyclase/phosphodiesterase n=1 Tax=Pannonibacter sp. SL95 TaxID=2995153 RepID=UPI0022752894|nr:EAL domain-containing protein [Pannonibacter sp. SL95]MCY1708798.1 EAL domain-containing protein [Pannonibacter sp. SL95]
MITLVRRLAIIAVLGLGLAAVIYSHLIVSHQSTVDQAKRYDIAWTGFNGRLEVTSLRERVARFAATGDQDAANDVKLFFQIVVGRLNTWGAGEFGKFIASSPLREARFEGLVRDLTSLEPLVEKLEEPQARAQLMRDLIAISTAMDRIGGEAYSASLNEAEAVRKSLRGQLTVETWITGLLLSLGSLLVVFLLLQNRWLSRAHATAATCAANHAFLARHDALTSLPNRLAFHDAFALEIERQRPGCVAVLAIDLDGFKAINDTLGHTAGDTLLIAVGDRLSKFVSLWPEASAARFGGDEFVVILRVEDGVSEALDKAENLRRALAEPYRLPDGTVVIQATIGLAVATPATPDPMQLPDNADLALSHAKARNKGTVQLFDVTMRADLTRRRRIESDLIAAIALGEISPQYQPQVDMENGRIVGVEALARWTHPILGRIGPDEFVPIAESSGKVVELGRAILERACAEATLMPADVKVSVNLSVAQLVRDDLVDTVQEILGRTGLSPARLKLEVTESIVMSDTDRCIATLRKLKQLGVAIALDDFGTGYSALSYLRLFDWDELKVDRSFVRSIGSDPHSLSIIQAVVGLASQLGIKVTVEGVETEEQRNLLRHVGCRIGQGYLFGAAVPLNILSARLLGTALPAPAGRRAHLRLVDKSPSAS